jgi:large subunit ribosomal protein L21
MYAVVETGGKQYRVKVGQTVEVERLAANVGDTIELGRVLLVSDEETTHVGRPVVEGAKVAATVVEHGRGPKVIIFKYRAKQHYRRKNGHRQDFTRLRIDDISA